MSRTFASAVDPRGRRSALAWWFVVRETHVLVAGTGATACVPFLADVAEAGVFSARRHYLGALEEHDCYAVGLDSDAAVPEGMALEPLRSLYGRLDDDLFAIAGRALQIVEWDRTHRYCGRCAAAMEDAVGERAKRCPDCGLLSFPRLSPAVIVAVRRGEKILLARGVNFPAAFYSVLAGFVEPGESLEEAVAREIREEVGVDLTDIRYFGSQPWPFPHSLMIGFTARHAGGEIRIDEGEIVDAGWFTADSLPEIPPKLSIARRLIDSFVAEKPSSYGDCQADSIPGRAPGGRP